MPPLLRRTYPPLLLLAAFGLRLLRPEWQPLWWDEGYSVYFATEPVGRMFRLTANDIHPPLYYLLLHGWTSLLGRTGPFVLRFPSIGFGLLSVALTIYLARILWPMRYRLHALAGTLAALNPMLLFYSQEVRMYGMAATFGLAATAALALAVDGEARAKHDPSARTRRLASIGYVIAAALLLHIIYYGAFLLLAHAIWSLIRFRHRLRSAVAPIALQASAALLFVPWLAYAVPRLIDYVEGKVRADADVSLGPVEFLLRHAAAFTAGHVEAATGYGAAAPTLGVTGLALLLLAGVARFRRSGAAADNPVLLPALSLALPVLFGFLVNLRYPFFPDGGERLLLLTLPYLLLIIAYLAVTGSPRLAPVNWAATLLLTAAAVAGVATYLTLPRHTDHDYRPIIRHVVTYGSNADTVFAIFPWQVGYWRTYAPRNDDGALALPQPPPLGQDALVWNDAIRQALEANLAQGVLWFPAPLSFGSTLPEEIEAFLKQNATNVENRWFNPATRLSAWARLPEPATTPVADSEPISAPIGGGASPDAVPSANTPLAVALQYHADDTMPARHVTIRLIDKTGRRWVSRDYGPLGSYARSAASGDETATEIVGMIVPVGLPPGTYDVQVGFTPAPDAEAAQSPPSLQDTETVRVASVEIHPPDSALEPYRLVADLNLNPPIDGAGIRIVGFSGFAPEQRQMAGTELSFELHVQALQAHPSPGDLHVALLDANGNEVAGYTGQPLPAYPPDAWPANALIRLPVSIFLPGWLGEGEYDLALSWIGNAQTELATLHTIAPVQVYQRAASYEAMQPTHALDAEIGTHARLYGYDVQMSDGSLQLTLYWEAGQPLLPPHHIFVHADDADGITVAQADSAPATASGPAPTGSWRTGEHLATQHRISLPAQASSQPVALHVGLYDPSTGVRLPVMQNGVVTGDSVEFRLAP